ncbi:hypothetical protein GCM10017083_22870 [Thalassobaculum fulvum]|uniref:Radical SAM protein n=1 Tax=Thalassobaculum fulvum TaxID=1633335 RepID=A0A918XRH7_9PROT|nr:radical SAM/SPASM domain-containing protein [Thalassobaculum fulvum]GHD49922.1 hypothetical protein GCM10017083_22870 [Thalassobaculum fulvum]
MVSRWKDIDRTGLPADHLLNVVGSVATPAAGETAHGNVGGPVPLSGARQMHVAETAFKRGLEQHNRGDVAAAVRRYRNALVVDPRHPGASRYLAKIELREGDRSGAFRRVLPLVAAGSTDRVVEDLFKNLSPHPRPVSGEPIGGLFRRDHFVGVTDRERAKRLFAQSIRNIDLELFSYCNRRCLYCPNAFIDRISANNYLPGPVYRMIVRDLAEIGYRSKVTLNFYNEPMADPVTLEACRELRAALPVASIRMNTNGDYLNRDSLAEIRDAGLNHLMISLHVSAVVDWDDDKVRFRAEQIYERLGRRPEHIDFRPGRMYQAFIPFEGMKVEVVQGNYNQFGYNIGGLMRHIPAPTERLSPCDEPFKSMTVTYNGNLTPCCRIRGDADDHKPYVTGNLADYDTIYEAWANEALAGWRRHLLGFNPKAAPCHECTAVRVADTPAERKVRDAAAGLMPAEERRSA